MAFSLLSPLAATKGTKFRCELCGKAAIIACQKCRVTYYCGEEHQRIDFAGIHDKICPLLAPLRTPPPVISSEEERIQRNLTIQMSQHALIELCKNEASKYLVAAEFELAIPGALQSLRFSVEVFGPGRIELVPAYLLLAEANLGLRRYQLAEGFLSQANWNLIKNPDCGNSLKSQLHRLFGKLNASEGKYDEALTQLANDIYFSSLEIGPEHIDTAGGYFYMASVFLLKNQVESALASFDKVVDIWYKFLINLRNHPEEQITDYLGEAQIGEATEMLRKVLEERARYLGQQHIAAGEAAYTLGILLKTTNLLPQAKECFAYAHKIYQLQLPSNHESTWDIEQALSEMSSVPLPEMSFIVNEEPDSKEPEQDMEEAEVFLRPTVNLQAVDVQSPDETAIADETAIDIQSPDETATDIQSPDETATDIQSPDETATDIQSPDETATDIQSPDETATDIQSPDETATDIESPDETATDIQSPDETATDIQSPDETATDIQSPDSVAAEATIEIVESVDVSNSPN